MAFNISDFLNAESKREIINNWKPVKISVNKLRPAPEKVNFYHTQDEEVRKLAESIELVGLQQYPVVRQIDGTEEYEVVAGHRRRLAILHLLEEGKTEFEMVPCKVEEPDQIKNELVLIFTNSTQRERTDYEKMREAERVRELLGEYQKTHELSGRKQDIIAGILGTSKTKIGTLDNINNNLIGPFKDAFASGDISTSAANEIAGLQEGAQKALYETYEQTGALTAKEAKDLKDAFPDGCLEEWKEEAYQYAKQTGIGIAEAAAIISERHQREPEAAETTPEPEKEQEEPQRGKTEVTYHEPERVDKRSLTINGKINPNKEFNGMPVGYFMEAVMSPGIFGVDNTDFWQGWVENANAKWEYLMDYTGTAAEYSVEGEGCKAVLTNTGLQVSRAAGQTAVIGYESLAELIDAMVCTKMIRVKIIEDKRSDWAEKTAKELLSFSRYLTEDEVYILQNLMMRCKERAGK